MRVDQLAVAPLGSFGVAVTTYVAQNRGANPWKAVGLNAHAYARAADQHRARNFTARNPARGILRKIRIIGTFS